MSDLRCVECDITRTYADAAIADLHESCDGSKHEWLEVRLI